MTATWIAMFFMEMLIPLIMIGFGGISMRGGPKEINSFTNDDGSLIHPDTFTKHLRKIYEELGFPSEFHLHTLRHYFVTTLLHNGVDKQTVAELAGHGDTSFLERTYCHPQMELKQHAAEVMMQSILSSY